jgi:hypothetical protein
MAWIPTTVEQIKDHRFGRWSGNPKGNKYVHGYCAQEVESRGTWVPHQCSRKNGYGPGALYCKQHGKMAEEQLK